MSVTYAITITIRPARYKDDLDTQYCKAKQELLSCCYPLSLVCELTKSYNLHFHGVIQAIIPNKGTAKQSIHNYFRKCKYLGFIYLKEITDTDIWYKYCFKNYDSTLSDLYFAPPVIIDEVEDFPSGLEILQLRNENKEIKDKFLEQFQTPNK